MGFTDVKCIVECNMKRIFTVFELYPTELTKIIDYK